MGIVLSSGKRELILSASWMNSAGILGFGSEARQLLAIDRLGAFVTAPISLRPRTPANVPRLVDLPGSFLLHTGLPNAGLRRTLQQELPFWSQLKIPLILHLMISDPAEVREAGPLLENVERIDALELGLEHTSAETVGAIIQAAIQLQLPFLLRLPFDSPRDLFETASSAGAHAIVIGPPRGCARSVQGELVSGRLYGPALFPMVLEKLARLRPNIGCSLIAGSGLFTHADIETALQAGADAVQLDTVLWTRPEILDELDTLIEVVEWNPQT